MRIKIDKIEEVFKAPLETPYSYTDVMEFMMLTGCNAEQTNKIMMIFMEYRITNLSDINTLAKLGFLQLDYFKNEPQQN